MTDRGPVNRCGVRGCVFIGHWLEGQMCPEHRNNPLTDKTIGRPPTLVESWDTDDMQGGDRAQT